MRNQSEWARKHRNGNVRARHIVTRQEQVWINTKKDNAIPKSLIYKCDKEMERRRNQIDKGQLKRENGLI